MGEVKNPIIGNGATIIYVYSETGFLYKILFSYFLNSIKDYLWKKIGAGMKFQIL